MAAQDFAGDCQHHDSEIKPDRPIFNVRQVASDPVLYLFDGFGFTTPTVYLSPSSDARFHAVTECIFGDDIAKQLGRRFGIGRMRRGPTMDMSPFNTLSNCGNSSTLRARSHFPSLVIRRSPRVAC
jgi:hypothetical protein